MIFLKLRWFDWEGRWKGCVERLIGAMGLGMGEHGLGT